ncbi:MAG TPA: SRPBCC domain-containing protein [Thermomicrobiales bacterium]|nr:SRPBCC domain-containing protein [Thermomicrobiales bacterium]
MNDIAPIVKETVLNATPEQVFDAYTDPKQLEKWFARAATIDLRANGAWRFDFGGGLAAEGRVLEAERPTRFVWTWEKSISPDENGVEQVLESDIVNTYQFEPVDGGTRFTIEERNHASQEIRDMSVGGIDQMIATLRAWLEDGVAVDWRQAPQ